MWLLNRLGYTGDMGNTKWFASTPLWELPLDALNTCPTMKPAQL